MRALYGLILVLPFSAALPMPRCAAQDSLSVSVSLDALVINTYRWRGIPRAGAWNAQAELSARLGGKTAGVAVGVWTNGELPGRRAGSLSELQPGHWGFSETNGWGELAHSFRALDAAVGFIWYQYRGRAGELGTGEVYGRIRGSGQNSRSISPELSVWYDVVKRKSGYVEAGATAPVLALPFRGVAVLAYLGATAGVAIGTPARRAELSSTNFAGTGFTSAELSAGVRAKGEKTFHGLLLNFAGHLQYAADSATRRTRLAPPRVSKPVRFYLTVGFGILWPAPRDK